MSLSRFARLLGLPAHQAEDALHSERAARAVLSRRSFFVASGAMVAGTGFSFAAPAAHECVISGAEYTWSNIKILLNGEELFADVVSVEFAPPVLRAHWPRNWKRNAGSVTYSASFELEREEAS